MIVAAELYAQVTARIEAIAAEVEALCDALPMTPVEDFPKVDKAIAELTEEHNCLIPQWECLRWLVNAQKKAEAR